MTQTAGRLAVDQALTTTRFWIPPDGIARSGITYCYETMPGNRPATYGDTVFLWATSEQRIPVEQPPLATQRAPNNEPGGCGTFDGLNPMNDSYLLGFGVGPEVRNVCATILVPAQTVGGAPTICLPGVQVTMWGSSGVGFQFHMPPGSQPEANGDWAGLWEGQGPSVLYDVPPNWVTRIVGNAHSGTAFVEGTIVRGKEYTLGYFKGGYQTPHPSQTTLACATGLPPSDRV
jgi:hypothetical protein